MRLSLERFGACRGCYYEEEKGRADACQTCERNPRLGNLTDNYVKRDKKDAEEKKKAQGVVDAIEEATTDAEPRRDDPFLSDWGVKRKN
jgi:hypothetical protein